VTAEDLTIWKQFPTAAFTLMPIEPSEDGEEYRLGSFDLGNQPLGQALTRTPGFQDWRTERLFHEPALRDRGLPKSSPSPNFARI
jgi:hypothetical protein